MRLEIRTLPRAISTLAVLFVLVLGASLDTFAQGNSRWGRSHNRGNHYGWTRGRRVGQQDNDDWRMRRRERRREHRADRRERRRDYRADRRENWRERRLRERFVRHSYNRSNTSTYQMRLRRQRAALRARQYAQRAQYRTQYRRR
jgi:hypothetical protein